MRRFVLIALVLAVVVPARAAEPTITNGTLTSFDGTPIVYTLFIPAEASATNRVPVILMTHGWGGTGAKENTGDVKLLVDAGYAVLTWDARGFGSSGGEANVDAQEFEVRDVMGLITLAAAQPEILTDGPDDPRMGMVGPSYAGGIQLMTASADPRIDAIAPDIAWNDLPYALFPHGVVKLGWGAALYGLGAATGTALGLQAGESGSLAAEIHQAFVEGVVWNAPSESTLAWFESRSPKRYINGATLPDGRVLPGIHAPTLLTQGTIDTLFNPNHAIASAAQIAANGVPTKMMFYCGGHAISTTGGCGTLAISGERIDQAVLAWFDRYVRRNTSANTGPAIEYEIQDHTWHAASALPRTTALAQGAGTVVNTIVATSGQPFAGGSAPEGLRFDSNAPAGVHLLGSPRATVTVSGVGLEASLFFKVLDVGPDGARVINDQVSAYKITDLSGPQTFTFDLAGLSWAVQEGHRIAIEISSTSLDHSSTRTPFVTKVVASVSLPYLTPAA